MQFLSGVYHDFLVKDCNIPHPKPNYTGGSGYIGFRLQYNDLCFVASWLFKIPTSTQGTNSPTVGII